MAESACRMCSGPVEEFLDLGLQPISQQYREPDDTSDEFRFRLAVGQCGTCTLVQQLDEVPPELMFRADYPFLSSSSSRMSRHFLGVAENLLRTALAGPDPFLVEIGSNDGIILRAAQRAGVRHLGFEPSGEVADIAAAQGVRVRKEFFGEDSAREVADVDGKADVIFAANTVSHIPDLGEVFRGVHALLAPDGVFVFEDPYAGDVVEKTAFDQIYDEHFYLFSARSVREAARRFGFELVDVRRVPVHGGEVRYTLARSGRRQPSPAVGSLLADEEARKLTAPATLAGFAERASGVRERLGAELSALRRSGARVVGYGATAKSATLLNYCGIGPELLPFICDSTAGKQGLVTPGTHIPVRPPEEFARPYPDYALLLAWNHAEEIVAKEPGFRESGGRWLVHVPEVRLL
ncbi:class I SAM-dependent methyltransferase [Streptomyces sp. AA4]|nr:class I SAM-dependent methyltransferase [Streptomyces sp. AA4]